jgi:hypothetical protein
MKSIQNFVINHVSAIKARLQTEYINNRQYILQCHVMYIFPIMIVFSLKTAFIAETCR